MDLEQIVRDNDVFDIGHAPALRGEGALRAFADTQALYEYIRATMPRYQPGRLTDGEYRDLVAYLQAINW